MSRLTLAFKKFPRVFWISNMMELFERWAWYGVYNSLALYLTLSKETGALGFTQEQKGIILGTGTALLYFLPLITGAIADRVGFKKVLILSFTAYIAGFFMVGHFNSFPLVFASYIFLACAGALFKPLVSGTIAKTTTPETSSIGFGIFYMMVNIGAFIGPFIAGFVYKTSWNLVFIISMCAIAVNYIFVFLFYKEPGREPSDKSLFENIGIAFKNIWMTINDWRYLLFLLIMSVFWSAYNQLFYSFPVFLEAWIDLDKIGNVLGLDPGRITAVTITSIDAFYIICLQIYISSLSMKLKPLYSIMTGILILAVGLMLMFNFLNPWIILLGVLVFGIGEMASSPKYTEYVGGIAPADKKALYMGTSFLPLAIGHYVAGWISGKPYEVAADKLYLLKKAVAESGFSIPDISDKFTRTDYFNRAQELFGMNSQQLTKHLWDTYHPSRVWILYSGLALAASILLFMYDKTILKGKDVNGK